MNRRTFLTVNLYALTWLGLACLKQSNPKSAMAEAKALQLNASTYGSGVYGLGVYVGEQPQSLANETSRPNAKTYLPMMVGHGN